MERESKNQIIGLSGMLLLILLIVVSLISMPFAKLLFWLVFTGLVGIGIYSVIKGIYFGSALTE